MNGAKGVWRTTAVALLALALWASSGAGAFASTHTSDSSATPSPTATGRPLALSSDGVTWSHDLTTLFPAAVMIPGDSQSARFFVRNDAVGAAVLNVALADVDATAPLNGAFFRSLRVGVAIAEAPGAQRTFTSAATADSLAHAELGSGDVVPVLVSIELPASAQTSAHLTQSVTFAVHVTLGEQEAVIPAVDPPAQRNDGGASHADVSLLSKTGVDAAGLPWALGAVVAGLLLVLFARLRRRRDARLSAAEGWSLRAAASSARARHEPCEPDAAGRVLPGAPPRA